MSDPAARLRRGWGSSPRQRLGLGLMAAMAVLLAGGLTYQAAAAAADRQRFPPPGRRVAVDGRWQHLWCAGLAEPGVPTVILEGGLGAPALIWALVQPSLAGSRRVCSYDRAGYGWSEPATEPRHARQLMTELHRLLAAAGERPPYVLVGHSLGALLARVYAADYPAEVAGLVLLDPRPTHFFEQMPPAARQIDERNRDRAGWLRALTPLGITRLASLLGWPDEMRAYLAPLPDDAEAAAWALMIHSPQHWATALAERAAIETSYQQADAARLADTLPLTVLTAEEGAAAWRLPSDPVDPEADAAWLRLQQEQARLTPRGEWQLVKASGHYLYFDQPQAVIAAVLALPLP